jgi:O-acetyl-ADP-ribose deacetylase (regulator of RNase III)
LPAKFVIHTVGPVWNGGSHGEPALLASCYRNSLRLAAQHGIKTIAFPAISCGVYGFPIKQAARIAVREIQQFIEREKRIEQVFISCFTDQVYAAYTEALKPASANSE